MFLTDEEERMLAGEQGLGVRKAMQTLVKLGNAFDAEKMVKLSSAHILPMQPLDWLMEMKEGDTKVRTLTTLHAYFLDPQRWNEMGIAEKYGERQIPDYYNRLDIYTKMGVIPIMTCVPYLTGIVPRMGSFFEWSGSSGQCLANSALGARGARVGDNIVMAGAITGRVPYIGLLKPENRYGRLLVEVSNDLDLENFTYADYGAIAYHVGAIAEERNVVFSGLPNSMSFEDCKYLYSPLPVSGAVTLCHIVGVTPEAPTLEAAFGNKKPEERIVVGESEMKEAYDKLNTATTDDVDFVTFGCPHCTINEIREIASLLNGKRKSENVELWVATAAPIRLAAERAGYVDIIEKAGGLVIQDCCVGAGAPFIFCGIHPKTMATNSARAAHYLPRTSAGRSNIVYGSTEDCIDDAITGKWRAR